MGKKYYTTKHLLLTIGFTFFVPLVWGYFLQGLPFSIKSVPLHSALEASGGIMAIVIALIFLLKNLQNLNITYHYWMGISLFVMGFIDIVHSLTQPSDLFIWLHSLSLFIGGILSTMVWIPLKKLKIFFYKFLPFILIFFTLFLIFFSVIFNYILPSMRNSDGTYSDVANVMNIIGSIAFFITSIYFFKEYLQTKSKELLFFIGFTLLFSSSGLLFINSIIWDFQWWFWHFLRFFAYTFTVYFIYNEFSQKLILISSQYTQLNLMNEKNKEYLKIIDKNVSISSTDTKGNITDATQVFCELTGYSKDELIGQQHDIVRHKNVSKKTYEHLWNTIKNNNVWKGELQNIKKDGSTYWIDATITPMFNKAGEKIGYTSIRVDITDKKMIEKLSLTDPLTSLGNRRHYDEILPKFINRAKRNKKYIVLAILDIDHFKAFNDNYGHMLGDIALESVGRILKATMKRSNDYAFRIGGEEFCVVYESENEKNGLLFANKIIKQIESLYITHEYNSASDFLTVSMGAMISDTKKEINVTHLYKNADALLYLAKSKGKNQVISNKSILEEEKKLIHET